jgi:hypothetical protein
VKYVPITDDEAMEAFQLCCKLEGIIPALESAHALAALPRWRPAWTRTRSSSSTSRAGATRTSSPLPTSWEEAVSARLSAAFAKGRPALVTFVTGGDPTPAPPAILDALVAGGADVIELGMPFTDPMADGPAIQAANLRSLAAGTRTADIFASRAISAPATPKRRWC